jgi:hypothetical protein
MYRHPKYHAEAPRIRMITSPTISLVTPEV